MQLTDRFELGELLGRGAFGSTYRGRERDGGRPVAIKQLHLRGLSEWLPVERFEREAQVLRSLAHPGLPEFIDAFEAESADGGTAFYIVSELIEGPTLQAEIARGRRWTTEQARTLLRSLLVTLGYLHSLSPRVIHRDIKPGNVIVRPDGSGVLVDFGSVRYLVAEQSGGELSVAGTVGYMAPEQALGISTVASDLYGLGATLVHAFTHVPPSELPRTGLRPRLMDLSGVDVQMARILERLLEPEPERRYESAAAVERALEEPAVDARALVPSATQGLARTPEVPRVIDAKLGEVLDTRDPQSAEQLMGALFVLLGGLFAGVASALLVGPPLGVVVMVLTFVGFIQMLNRSKGTARRLYAQGTMVRGEIRRATMGESGMSVSYAFRHGDRELSGTLQVQDAFSAALVRPDTQVLVFFDPKAPQRNVGVLDLELQDGGQELGTLVRP